MTKEEIIQKSDEWILKEMEKICRKTPYCLNDVDKVIIQAYGNIRTAKAFEKQ